MSLPSTIHCASCGALLPDNAGAADVVCSVCGKPQIIERHEGVTEAIENTPAPHRVVDVFRYLVRHPVEMLIYRWNWKAALMSGVMRSMIYLFTHLKEGWRAALGAMSVEFIFRLIVSGASGSLVQAFHNAAPVWLATLCVMIMLPALKRTIKWSASTLVDGLGRTN